ncbi:DUF6944 family repetitive protein [Texcoconibacillus texcoconensis]|uniref:Uncharacterized protein n=1 Tax=Texcoconibacillus texcoconensis TaxID=1095777 RepID=A0A840QS71_9BACI|nr:hypothetical protein [Texcoconibacillus texcoconensis]MBB5174190.1 hypothetical protein [Texcoconibacillus texcoconensis]
MYDDELLLVGSWTEALGQLTAAIGATRQIYREEDIDTKLQAIGESLQSTGNLFQAVGTPNIQDALGDWIEVGGTAGSAVGGFLVLRGDEVGGNRLETLGDGLQSFGSTVSASIEDDDRLWLAHRLQALGAGLESIAGVYQLQGKEQQGFIINSLGSWIQFSGGFIQAIISTSDYQENQHI